MVDRDVGAAGGAGLGGPPPHLGQLLRHRGKRDRPLLLLRLGGDPHRLLPPPPPQFPEVGQLLLGVVELVLLIIVPVVHKIGAARKEKAEGRGDQVQAPVDPELGGRDDAEQGGQHQIDAAHPVAVEGDDPADHGKDGGGDRQRSDQPRRHGAGTRRKEAEEHEHAVNHRQNKRSQG